MNKQLPSTRLQGGIDGDTFQIEKAKLKVTQLINRGAGTETHVRLLSQSSSENRVKVCRRPCLPSFCPHGRNSQPAGKAPGSWPSPGGAEPAESDL